MRPTTHSFLDGFATVRQVLDVDELTPEELLRSLDPHQEGDPSLTPWRRGYNAGIRAALGR